jgi:hypothetical protein
MEKLAGFWQENTRLSRQFAAVSKENYQYAARDMADMPGN